MKTFKIRLKTLKVSLLKLTLSINLQNTTTFLKKSDLVNILYIFTLSEIVFQVAIKYLIVYICN